MNGLDSIIINFLQVQLWKSVASIKNSVKFHCTVIFYIQVLLKLTEKKAGGGGKEKMTILYMSLHHFYLWVVLLSNAALSLFKEFNSIHIFTLYTNTIFLLWDYGVKIALCVLTHITTTS